MTLDDVSWAPGVIATVGLAVVGWWTNRIARDMDRIERETTAAAAAITALAVKLAEDYPSNKAIERMEGRMDAAFKRLDERFDRLSDKLDERTGRNVIGQ